MAKKKPGGGNPSKRQGGRVTDKKIGTRKATVTRVNRRDPRLNLSVLIETYKELDRITGETEEIA